MSDIQRAIDKQAKLEAEASPSDWRFYPIHGADYGEVFGPKGDGPDDRIILHSAADADLIAHLRNQAKLARAVLLASKAYRDKVDYTGGDSTEYFSEEQQALDDALAAWAKQVNGDEK